MAFDGLLVTEIFASIQGETSLSGLPFTFVRLTGCNLRCSYCDTSYAFHGGTRMGLEEVLSQVRTHGFRHVLLTGGEPLLQRNTRELAKRLQLEGFRVSIETHGELPIHDVAGFTRIIMDIKTPSSAENRGGFEKNLPFLKDTDEVKFVIASEEDYFWAKKWIESKSIPTQNILLSPAVSAQGQPGMFSEVSPAWLARRILTDRLDVRLQLQIHKIIWGRDQRGV